MCVRRLRTPLRFGLGSFTRALVVAVADRIANGQPPPALHACAFSGELDELRGWNNVHVIVDLATGRVHQADPARDADRGAVCVLRVQCGEGLSCPRC